MPMLEASIGRARVTSAVVYPSEAGYIRYMRSVSDSILGRLQQIINKVEAVTPEAILYALEPIEKNSQAHVPILTGALQRSFFKEVRESAQGPRVVIGYAKHGHPFYAAMQHERLDFRHAKGRRAKFLERAVHEEQRKFVARLTYFIQHNAGLKGNLYG